MTVVTTVSVAVGAGAAASACSVMVAVTVDVAVGVAVVVPPPLLPACPIATPTTRHAAPMNQRVFHHAPRIFGVGGIWAGAGWGAAGAVMASSRKIHKDDYHVVLLADNIPSQGRAPRHADDLRQTT